MRDDHGSDAVGPEDGGSSGFAETELKDGLDPELAALPRPPSGRRFLTGASMLAVIFASAAMIAFLRADIRYFFAHDEAAPLGAVTSLDPARAEANQHVQIQGLPMRANTVRYKRLLSSNAYEVFPLAGQRVVFVQTIAGATEPSGATPGSYTGRLVTFGMAGSRYAEVRRELQRLGMNVTDESFLLLADQTPRDYAWAPLLALLFATFLVVNVGWFVYSFVPLARLRPAVARAERRA
ncbi:MAG: hypothetical protein IT379_04445 [Deltaproteobacteria bacterium]|nr:hypothetical protein [Deltaproteobacteria bacterium]